MRPEASCAHNWPSNNGGKCVGEKFSRPSINSQRALPRILISPLCGDARCNYSCRFSNGIFSSFRYCVLFFFFFATSKPVHDNIRRIHVYNVLSSVQMFVLTGRAYIIEMLRCDDSGVKSTRLIVA